MKLFKCAVCGQVVYFENGACLGCGAMLGYLPEAGIISPVTPEGAHWHATEDPGTPYRFCTNWELSACNWLVRADEGETLCLACRHNRTIPDISDPFNHSRWQEIEQAKRRLFYSLLKLRLPVPTIGSGDAEPLVFDFLADWPGAGPKVTTGHDNGVITLSLDEADAVKREEMRARLGETYRTLLGHFRHEIGHYYWDRLVRDGGNIDSFRALFGDETADYGAAMERHYQFGAPPDWQMTHVSAYSTMHPWEDWAESWAHYLHIVDTLEMASAFGITIRNVEPGEATDVSVDFDPHAAPDIQPLIEAWLPLTFAVNSLNRAMGQPDLYPFVLAPRAIEKLAYINGLVQRNRRTGGASREALPSTESFPIGA